MYYSINDMVNAVSSSLKHADYPLSAARINEILHALERNSGEGHLKRNSWRIKGQYYIQQEQQQCI